MRSLLVSLLALGAAVAAADGGAARAEDAKIQIMGASYGYAMNRKDVKDDVAKYCDGKVSCTFKVTNASLAMHQPLDPSPGDDKGLIMSWKCGATTKKYEFAEGKNATVDCK